MKFVYFTNIKTNHMTRCAGIAAEIAGIYQSYQKSSQSHTRAKGEADPSTAPVGSKPCVAK